MAPALRLLALVCTASALVVRDGGEPKAALANGAPAIELEPAERREFRPRYSCPAAQSAPERQQARRCAARLLPAADPPGDEIPRVVVVRGLN